MADFIDKEAEESDEELDEYTEKEKKKLRKLRNESDDEEDEDEEQFQEELQDLIDDNPIDEEEEEDDDVDRGRDHRKRKKKDDDEDDNFDDGLDDEDLDLLEENLGVKINRQKKFKRLRRIEEEESDEEVRNDAEAIANELFEGSDQEDEHKSRDGERDEEEFREHSESEGEYSETDDFIVDDEGRPISKKKRRPIFSDAALQEAQDIFGVDFDYNDFEKYEYDEEMEEDEEEYENEEDEYGERVYRRKPKKTRKGTSRKSIYEVYEPYDLERGHFTDLDNEIRNTDLPERMQLRSVPVTATAEGSDDKELDQEAEWIYKQAFSNATISNQEGLRDDFNHDKGSQVIPKIRKALDFMRNLNLEVPFIAFYRKEYVEPELNINDLWLIYKYDEKWCQLQIRKTNLLKLFEKMEKYLEELIMRNADQPLPGDLRLIKSEDYERLRSIQSVEELKDIYCHFLLYYGQELSNMQEYWRKKDIEDARQRKREERRKQLEEEGDPKDPAEIDEAQDDDVADEINESAQETIKQAIRSDPYSICKRAGLEPLSRKFGLTPEQFGENLRDNYQRHEVEQHPVDPIEVAEDFVNEKFPVKEDILKAAKFMVATQLSKEPLVRHCVRETFFEKAQIAIKPTKKGLKEIDENHPCYSMKYIQDKPVRDLCGDQFLKLIIAEEDKLLEIGLGQNIRGATGINYVEEVKQYYYKDEFSRTVQEWNDLRGAAVEMTLNNFLFPLFRKELRAKLINESKEYVKKACAKRIYDWLKVSPYSIEYPDEDDDDWDTSGGLKVMGLAYSPDPEVASYASVVNPTGECSSFIKLQNLLFRKDGWKQEEKMAKEKTLNLLKTFISNNKPHIICVGGESREALMILEDLRFVVSQLVEDEQIPQIPVELLENSLAKVFANSVKSETEFREYPPLLKQSISLARRIQDPLVEFSQLCTVDEEILCLQYHTLQSRLSKEELLETVFQEFINRTNEVGVDLNQIVAQPHTINLLQFICGLGPRKAHALIKTLKQSNSRLENRTQLVTTCHMGPKVFINCAGFIKIDTNSLGDSTDAYVEVLDGSRVHPETYEWARKMAVDALEYDEMQEDANPAGALEEILETPEKLKDLDLDAFAEELKRQGFGNKKITLYDIRAELTHRYKDLRTPYQPPNPEEVFNMLTKETPETFYIGKLIMCSVIGTAHRKPKGEQLDKANPVRNDENGMWQCPFCTKCDFQELSEVWNHFDAGSCPGQAVGIRIRLDNGISGFIPIKFLSDNTVNNPDERVHRGQVIHARITKIDVEKFTIECTSRSSDLLDKNGDLKPPKDPFYDYDSEMRDQKTEDERAKLRQRQTYIKRVIVHPSFKNIGYAKTESMMADMDQGEVIFRPSSKASDHLTVTWKVTDNVYQHIDIRESGKENAFSLGQSLWIGNEEFEDLDEIMARHITPMSAHARDLLNFRYYRDTDGGKREISEEILKEDRRKNSSKIHYLVSASKEFPGKFLLSYLPRQRVYHEYITVTPQGYRFRKQNFGTLAHLFRWFKEHFRDPVPATPRSVQGGSSVRTPYMNAHTPSYPSTTATPINPTHAVPTSQMIHPAHFPHNATNAYGGAYSYVNTPYTPSGQTPYMTPFQTPHTTHTPRYGNHTPNHFPNSRGYNSTPYTPGPHTPHNNFTSHSRHPRTPNENSSWQRASDSWSGHSRNNRNQGKFNRDNQKSFYNNNSDNPRKSTSGVSAEEAGRTTPDFDAEDSTGNQSPQNGVNNPNTRSITSTPQTNTSPRSMMESVAGDATPLYDE